MRSRLAAVLMQAFLVLTACALQAQTLAPRPPMGWNSWDSYALTIDEAQFRANVAVQVQKLKPFGYTLAVIDEGWFLPDPGSLHSGREVVYEVDANGRYIPVPARFPSALEGGQNTGFHALAASIHAQGLQFGIHIVRGIPRVSVDEDTPIADSSFHAQQAADKDDACPWDPTNYGVRDNPAGQAWYDSLLKQYAGWGVDFIKVDCVSDHPYKSAEIRMIHNAIVHTGRPIVLSLSPGPTSEGHAAELQKYAQMWRVSDDVWDHWKAQYGALSDQFAILAGWVPFNGPGSWPDADMLPLGHLGPIPGQDQDRETRLTHDEQRTMMTLWCMARSPLIVGANLTRLNPWTLALLTNPDVLAIDQKGHKQMQQSRQDDIVSWTAEGDPGTHYLALFNVAETAAPFKQAFAFFGFSNHPMAARELWTGKEYTPAKGFDLVIPSHGVALLRLTER